MEPVSDPGGRFRRRREIARLVTRRGLTLTWMSFTDCVPSFSSALFYASSTSVASVVQALSPHALKNDGSLHEAARCLQFDVASILIKHDHNPNFPSRLHGGRSALGELCLYAEVMHPNQRTDVRHLIRLFLQHGANPTFKARNERSAVLLALDNPQSALEVTEALLYVPSNAVRNGFFRIV